MSDQVPTTFIVKYENNMRLALQQNDSRLIMCATQGVGEGEAMKLDDIVGAADYQEAIDRHGDTLYSNTPHDRVWLTKPPEIYFAELVDRADKMASGIELEGAYVMAGRSSLARGQDDRFLQGMFGNMQTGKKGELSVPFSSNMVVPVDTGLPVGVAGRLNTAKIRAAAKKLRKAMVDENEQWYMALTAEQNDDLLNEVPITSNEFGSLKGRVSADGKRVEGMLGFEFKHIELGNPRLRAGNLTLDVNGYRKNPFWTKSGMAVRTWEEVWADITTMPGKRYSRQIYASMTKAATRTDNGKVGYILNKED